ncbi:MAG: MBL fold metallo-hydrolase [Candidatus Omnitrophica bacterium]|nr:MBL fold metallo-hydrolase [Candidatus Omnitrophota bacterium]
MILETVVVGPYQANCYILAEKEGSEAIIIDPGGDYNKIKKAIDKYELIPKIVINTHGHIDHIGANDKFRLPVYIHKDDANCLLDSKRNMSAFLGSPVALDSKIKTLNDKDKITLGKLSLEVIHTPGHTPGGICLKIGDIVFTGDTLFYGGIGRTDFPYASEEKMRESLKKLMSLPDKIKIFPGHGQASSIGEEKKSNPFI